MVRTLVLVVVLLAAGCRCNERYERHPAYYGEMMEQPPKIKTVVAMKATKIETGKPAVEVSFSLTN